MTTALFFELGNRNGTDLRCDVPVGHLLSLWQIAKKVGQTLLVPEAAPLWENLAAREENYIIDRALGPPSISRGAAKYFLRHLRDEFVGSAGALGPFVDSLLTQLRLESGVLPLRCWDVGAAIFDHESAPQQMAHEEVWSICRAHGGYVRAFEPSRESHLRLAAKLGVAAEHLALSNYTGSGHLILGGRNTGSLGFKGCGIWVAESECEDQSRWEVVNVTTVDTLLGPPPASLDILKVDAEGSDWEVALGAQMALAQGRVGMVILEYGDKWSRDMALAAKWAYGAHQFGPAEWLSEPNLRFVARWFTARGYSGYLIGTKTLLPIEDPWWHDVYEMCRTPHQPHYHGVGNVCFMDVAFVHKSHRFGDLVRNMISWSSWAA